MALFIAQLLIYILCLGLSDNQTTYSVFFSDVGEEPITVEINNDDYKILYGDVYDGAGEFQSFEGYRSIYIQPLGLKISIPENLVTDVPLRESKIKEWSVNECHYEAKVAYPFYDEGGVEFLYYMQGLCDGDEYYSHFIYSSEKGLVSFSKGVVVNGYFSSDLTYFITDIASRLKL